MSLNISKYIYRCDIISIQILPDLVRISDKLIEIVYSTVKVIKTANTEFYLKMVGGFHLSHFNSDYKVTENNTESYKPKDKQVYKQNRIENK